MLKWMMAPSEVGKLSWAEQLGMYQGTPGKCTNAGSLLVDKCVKEIMASTLGMT